MTDHVKKTPVLTARLQLIGELALPCQRLIDIGCDHAYLAAALLSLGKIERAVCTDIHEKPLQKASALIQALGLESRCELIHCDGFGEIRLESGDSVVIAGMGGYEIRSILSQRELPDSVRLILQANWNREVLRDYLAKQGCHIHEYAIRDKKMLYSVWLVQVQHHPRNLSLTERSIGEYWLSEDSLNAPNAKAWLSWMLELYRAKSQKYPEYALVCDELEQLCRRHRDDL